MYESAMKTNLSSTIEHLFSLFKVELNKSQFYGMINSSSYQESNQLLPVKVLSYSRKKNRFSDMAFINDSINAMLTKSLFIPSSLQIIHQYIIQTIEETLKSMIPPICERVQATLVNTCLILAQKDFKFSPDPMVHQIHARNLSNFISSALGFVACEESLAQNLVDALKAMLFTNQLQNDSAEQFLINIVQKNLVTITDFMQEVIFILY